MNQDAPHITRRAALGRICAGLATTSILPAPNLAAAPRKRAWQIGACDWSINQMAKLEAFDVAKQIGLDGLQVSLGTLQDNMRLLQKDAQREVSAKSMATGVRIASLAIPELNNTPYKSDPKTIPWVEGSIDACKSVGAQVVLLAFFVKGDLRDDPEGISEVVRRLKAIAPKAEKSGVILGIESYLSAERHIEIIDRVGSNAVQVYYDVCNSTDRGYDIFKEIRTLGRKRICEFHAKENGALLGKGNVDFVKVRQALEDINYKGWIQIEGAVPPGGDLIESYKANAEFLRKTFSLA
jgi:sugar phosphate isomerase/epimerase